MNTNVTIGKEELNQIKDMANRTEAGAELGIKAAIWSVLMQECEVKELPPCAMECANTALEVFDVLKGA